MRRRYGNSIKGDCTARDFSSSSEITDFSITMKYLVFTLIVMIAINGITAAPSLADSKAVCSPWLGFCHITDQCCRDLVCLSYAAKCVPGKIINDNRPIGDGPFPPKN